jgi:hypothetical protein
MFLAQYFQAFRDFLYETQVGVITVAVVSLSIWDVIRNSCWIISSILLVRCLHSLYYCPALKSLTFGAKITSWETYMFLSTDTTKVDLTICYAESQSQDARYDADKKEWRGKTWQSITISDPPA